MTSGSTEPDGLLASRVRVPPDVVYREFPEETVVLNVSTGTYHGLNAVAGVILRRLESSDTVAAAIETITREFDAPAERIRGDVLELCGRLLERGLIAIDGRVK